MVLAAHQRQRAAQRARVGEGPEIARAVVLPDAREGEAGDRVVQVDLEQQELLVVPETDVVARVELLDQLAFQQQRLGLAAHDVEVEVVDGVGQRLELQVPAHAPGGLEILAHPLAQVPRLADIDHRPEAVAHQVDARLVGQRAQLLADLVGYGHAGSSLQHNPPFLEAELLCKFNFQFPAPCLSCPHDAARTND